MDTTTKTAITVSAIVNAPVEKVWTYWNEPQHITKWNQASDDWHTPHSENDLSVGGKFKATMAAKDGSFSFDFWGIYSKIDHFRSIYSILGDNRQMKVEFIKEDKFVRLTETFEAETENPLDMQQMGWQSILNNFKKYAESNP